MMVPINVCLLRRTRATLVPLIFLIACIACAAGTTSPSSNQAAPVPIPRDGLAVELLLSNDARDSSGNGNQGTATGCQFTTDRLGNKASAISFDGTGGSVVTQRAVGLVGSAARAISFWLWADSPLDHMCIVGYGSNISSQYFMIETVLSDGGNSTFVFNGSWNMLYCPDSRLVAGQWEHFVASYDGSVLSLYVNGTLQAMASTALSTADSTLTVGLDANRAQDDWNLPFKGKIDDIRVYSRALTDADVSALCNEGGYSVASTFPASTGTGTGTPTPTPTPTSSITVTYPTSSTAWGIGYDKTIDWKSDNIAATESMKIELLYQGNFERTISASTANDGAYTWTVKATHPGPAVFSGSTPNGYTIKITWLAKTSVTDTSPEFRIYTP